MITLAFTNCNFERNFNTIFPSRQDWKFKDPTFENNSIVVYIDGFKTSEGVRSIVYVLVYASKHFKQKYHALELCIRS